MNRFLGLQAMIGVAACLALSGCAKTVTAQEQGTGPVPMKVVHDVDPTNFQVEHAEQFPLATAAERMATASLNVTGSVGPDVSRQVPVPSLATGKITEIDARLGDTVQKGQLLFKVRSTDIAGAYSDYRKAIVSEQLANMQLNRAQILYDHGVIPHSTLETAENAEDSAQVDVDTTSEHLNLLGSDLEHPTGIVEVHSPVDGVITDQQITSQSGVQALSAPNPFTISDMSSVWIVCDIYENDLPNIHMDDPADIHLNAYPNRVFKGRVSNIGAILDPTIRTAKVRIEVPNSGMVMRLGMFASVTFWAQTREARVQVPSSAVLHIHDRDFVYVPAGQNRFRRVEVVSGDLLAGDVQEIKSGLKPGDQVVADALVLDHVVTQ